MMKTIRTEQYLDSIELSEIEAIGISIEVEKIKAETTGWIFPELPMK